MMNGRAGTKSDLGLAAFHDSDCSLPLGDSSTSLRRWGVVCPCALRQNQAHKTASKISSRTFNPKSLRLRLSLTARSSSFLPASPSPTMDWAKAG